MACGFEIYIVLYSFLTQFLSFFSYRFASSAEPAVKAEKQQNNKGNKGGGNKTAAADSTSSEEDIRKLRIQKADELRIAGREPYAYTFDRTHSAQELQDLHKDLANGEQLDDISVSCAGRIMARRVMGKLAFARLVDASGAIQLYVDKKTLDEQQEGGFAEFKNLIDTGDIVGVEGGLRRTDKGELSIVVRKLTVLTKSLLPLPDKWHGLADVEARYRKRYLDMIVTPGVIDTFKARSKVVSTIRRYLEDREFLEVETPVLESAAGGADARPFVTYHNTLRRDFTLRIATELHLKRLVVGGLEKVFEIGRIFRNEGMSSRHNPEFTSIELYQAYADYNNMMELTETLIREASQAVLGVSKVDYQGQELDFGKPFRRATMHDLVHEATGVNFEQFSKSDGDGGLAAAKEAAITALQAVSSQDTRAEQGKIATAPSIGHVLNEVFEALVESTLRQPTFVLDHPVEISPLAKPHRSRAGVVERFELFVAGRELANSFSELTDPVDQRSRLEAQVAAHQLALDAAAKEAAANGTSAATTNGNSSSSSGSDTEGDDEAPYEVKLDEDFLTALEYGMPPTGGMGMGIDRLVMLLTDSASIRDVIAFPLMK
jgi:lysyl-tRNA synthetase class 2